MVIIKLTWWLWNQMFQYALWKNLSLRHKVNFALDIFWFENYKLHKYCLEFFHIHDKYASKKEVPFYEFIYFKNKYLVYILEVHIKPFLRKYNPHHFVEKQFNFDPNVLTLKSGYVEWYFQTEKYFNAIEKDLRKDFSFKITPSKKNQDMIDIIKSCNAVSLHIRRGDYISNTTTNTIHGTCNLDYYKRAVEYIKKNSVSPIFFIFSDDIDWVKDNLHLNEKHYYIDWNNADTNYEDMRLMSLCKHNVIANSSFSWWGAWLNNNAEKIVIAPQKWFNDSKLNTIDVIPEKRIKI